MRVRLLGRLDRRHERLAGQSRRRGRAQARQVEDGRHQVDAPRVRLRAHAPGDPTGHPQDERYAQRDVVDEEAVLLFLVLAERLAVIGGDHHQRAVGNTERGQPRQEPPEDLIRVRDLAVVWGLGVTGLVRRRSRVRRVRVVEVDPGEERPAPGGRALDPWARTLFHLRRAPLVLGEEGGPLPARLERVVELVEPAIQTRLGVHNERPDESPGHVRLALEDLGQRPVGSPERRGEVVADAVLERVEPGEDGRVRGARQRHLHDRLLEQAAIRSEPVHDRRRRRPGAVRADPVRPQGVNRHEQDVRATREAGLPGRIRDRRAEQQRRDDGGKADDGSCHVRPRSRGVHAES